MKQRKISRRRFLKTGLAWVAGTTAGLSCIGKAALDKGTKAVSRTSLKPLRPIPTTCEQCPAGCGITAYLDGERLVQILGNPDHPNNRGGICAKGIAGINLVNDPERLLHPLKRAGARGSGKWTKISWDEAYTALSRRLQEMLDQGRMNGFVVDIGYSDVLLDEFLSSLGGARIIDRTAWKNLNRSAALESMIGSSALIEDVGRSRTIFNFGANPFANHDHFIGLARRLVLARTEKGARLVTFDVRMSETAAQSDAWHPVRAGTDGIIALAMARVITDNRLADRDFIEERTNLSFSALKGHLSPYTLERAERESGMKAADIEQLAVEFATQKPSVAIFGGGVTDHVNGTQGARCVSLLNWLVGNLEKAGGLFFPRLPGSEEPEPDRLIPSFWISGITGHELAELKESNSPIDTYFSYLSNPVFSDPDCRSTARLLKNENLVPFLVVMDTHLTETGLLADMVLPAATYLEGWGLSFAPSLDGNPILNLRQPAVSLLSVAKALRSPSYDAGKLLEPSFLPKGEAVEIGNVCLELSRRIGGSISGKIPYLDTQDFVARKINALPELRTQQGLNALKERGFWVGRSQDRKSSSNQTSTAHPPEFSKVEIYSPKFKKENNSPLPEYQTPAAQKKRTKDSFILTPYKTNLMGRRTANSKWAREIFHENRLWMNRDVAARMAIKDGDKVRVTSSAGSLTVRVLTTRRIHPESVALAEGLGHTAVGNVARARRFKSKDRDTHLIWWEKTGNGVNPMEIVERVKDPIGGGQGLKDTRVQIEKEA